MTEHLQQMFQYRGGRDGYLDLGRSYLGIYHPDKLDGVSRLREYDKRAQELIEHAKQVIEDLKSYRVDLFERYKVIANAESRLQVKIERKIDYYGKKIYYVYLYRVYEEAAKIQPDEILREEYEGRKRSEALKRFAELCKEYPSAEEVRDIDKRPWER